MKKQTKHLLYALAIAGVIVIAINYYYKKKPLEEYTEKSAMQLANRMGGGIMIV